MQIKLNPPFFLGYQQPHGYLDSSREAHGLWNYYLCARNAYETQVVYPLSFEGERAAEPDYRQLFTSLANVYGVEPDSMAKCWDMVDMQCVSLDLPKLPNEERYRFDRSIIIVRH